MTKVVSVRFRTVGKVYYFEPGELSPVRGDHVIVETARGVEYGTVVAGVKEVPEEELVAPLKPIIRMAGPRDDEQFEENLKKEKEALKICAEKARVHELDMKLIDAEYTFDNNKILFYFTADGRIDFRELVKDLAAIFKTRIELRQIGVRDETKIMGGIGICGRPLCCHTYLSDFAPVSIKMAKEQNLSLNPTKISGVCGRLMCCLNNEEEAYEELNKNMPNVGDFVVADDGVKGTVYSMNVLRQTVKVLVTVGDTKEMHDYEVSKLRFKTKRKQGELTEEEMREFKELDALESADRAEREDAAAKREERIREKQARIEKQAAVKAAAKQEAMERRESRVMQQEQNNSQDKKPQGNPNNQNKNRNNQNNKKKNNQPVNEQEKKEVVDTEPANNEGSVPEKANNQKKNHHRRNRNHHHNNHQGQKNAPTEQK